MPRQALILIHGIGEQHPMATLRGFADAILPPRKDDGAKYYNKPDTLADNFEMRRLVSIGGRDGHTDFYEFYWAHLMPVAAWDRLVSWYWGLMWRWPKEVPAEARSIWLISWLATSLIFGAGIVQAIRFLAGDPIAGNWTGNLPWLFVVLGIAISAFVRGYVGDAAIYLSTSPRNIEARQKVRAAGLALLERVAATNDYDRIIVVGHSLGSMIGYDILSFAWHRHYLNVRAGINAKWRQNEYPQKIKSVIGLAETVANDIGNVPESERAEKWQFKTRRIHAAQRQRGDGWLVTDFVTLGSPLARGVMLLAKNRSDFERRAQERELAQCPPVREGDEGAKKRFSFEHEGTDGQGGRQNTTVLHDAAVFAVVNWTNLYFPCRWIFKGDFLAGPVAPIFGPGIKDVALATHSWLGGWFFAHTLYWHRNNKDQDSKTAPLPCLLDALDLGRKKMKTQRLQATRDEHIERALRLLRLGELVAVPTETGYGLAADARQPETLAMISAIQKYPANHPLIVHIADASALAQWADPIPETALRLAAAFWPGPLTLLLHQAPYANTTDTRKRRTIGLRVPEHPALLNLLRQFNSGLAVYPHEQPSLTSAKQVLDVLSNRIAAVLDSGPCAAGQESTIVDLTGPMPRILRNGPITSQQLEAVLGTSVLSPEIQTR
jgi:tRNA threonylcarbamoyl adenosine modification protein (Sua5/YciO/YrdC/YwlC family)